MLNWGREALQTQSMARRRIRARGIQNNTPSSSLIRRIRPARMRPTTLRPVRGPPVEFRHMTLACVRQRSDECPERCGRRARRSKVKTFTIENQTSNITLHATIQEAEAVPDSACFGNEAALARLAATWPAGRPARI